MKAAYLLYPRFTAQHAVGTSQVDPQPPYDAGSPAKAPAEIGAPVSSSYAQRCT